MPYDPVLKKNLVKKVLTGPVNSVQDPHVLNAAANVVDFIAIQTHTNSQQKKKKEKEKEKGRDINKFATVSQFDEVICHYHHF